MLSTVRVLYTVWRQRWVTAREDGATTIEYVLLVLLGIAVAGLATVVITQVVKAKDAQIQSETGTAP
jgi:Flp pilus assembly pilin Flp